MIQKNIESIHILSSLPFPVLVLDKELRLACEMNEELQQLFPDYPLVGEDLSFLWKDQQQALDLIRGFETYSEDEYTIIRDLWPQSISMKLHSRSQNVYLKYSRVTVGSEAYLAVLMYWNPLNAPSLDASTSPQESMSAELGSDPLYEKYMNLKDFPPDKLDLLVTDGNGLLAEISDGIREKRIEGISGSLHSLKAIFRSLGFRKVVELIHEFEGHIVPAQNIMSESMLGLVGNIQKEWQDISNVAMVLTAQHRMMAESGQAEQARMALLNEFNSLKQSLEDWWDLVNSKEFRAFESKLKSYLLQPLTGLESVLKSDLLKASKKLNKQVQFQFKVKADFLFNLEQMSEFRSALQHLTINALVHGIQASDQRVKQGKSAEGLIRVSSVTTTKYFTILVEDDGHGLQRDKIIDSLVSKGENLANLLSLSEQDLFMKLIVSKTSTYEKVNDYAGRGFGMNSVLKFVEKYKGDLIYRQSILGGACIQLVFEKNKFEESEASHDFA